MTSVLIEAKDDPASGVRRLSILTWTIASAVGLDYFDNTAFSFYVTRIAGGVEAPVDELVWASSAYAVCAILGILQYFWWIQRIGHRAYIAGGCFLFALGGLAAAATHSSFDIALARAVQGYAMGPMMGAVRILIRSDVPAARRPTAIRIFLIMIMLGSSLAPLIGGNIISAFDWRALFVVTALTGGAIGVVALFFVPSTGRIAPEEQINPELWPYAAFAIAIALLQIVAQELRFEIFSQSLVLEIAALVGVVMIIGFIYHQWNHPNSLLHLHGFRDRLFRTGLLVYALYYAISTMLSYLISRFLIGSLDYPIEIAGSLVSYCALPSFLVLWLYFTLSGAIPNRRFLIIGGFVIAAVTAGWMTTMPPDASMAWLVPPLLLKGLLLIFIVLPTANATFGPLSVEDFVQHYRVKNVVRQIVLSSSTAAVIVIEQHRFALHYDRLRGYVSVFNPALRNVFASAVPRTADLPTLARLAAMVSRQARLLATLDGFAVVMVIALFGAVIAVVQRAIR